MKRKFFLGFSFLIIAFSFLAALPLSKSEKLTGILLKEIDIWQNIKSKNIKKGLDLQGGSRIIYEAQFDQLDIELSSDEKKDRLDFARDKIESRANKFGVAEAKVYTIGNDRVGVEMPGVDDPTEIINDIGRTGQLVFLKVVTVGEEFDVVDLEIDPADVKSAKARIAQQNSAVRIDTGTSAEIAFEIIGEGRQKFADATSELVGTMGTILILLDDQELFNGGVSSAITDGEGVMTGFTDLEEAHRIAQTIEDGALPVPLEILSQNQIEASLGEDALGKMIIAGLIAFFVISLLMVMIFKFLGIVAVFDLFAYTVITITLFKLLGVVLTLSGIAGFLLSVGIELDSSILFFSRVKEELRKGKPVPLAVTDGFGNAWSAIKDSNVAAIITGLALFYFGTPQVKGFAITLILGLLTTLFTSIFLTREIMESLASRKFFQNLKLFGVKESEIEETEKEGAEMVKKKKAKFFKPLKFTKLFVGITTVSILGSVIIASLPHDSGVEIGGKKIGIALGTEFEGGSNMDVTTDKIEKTDVESIFESLKIKDLEVNGISNGINIKFEAVTNDKKDEIISALKIVDPEMKTSFETIGSSLSREILTNSLLAILVSSVLIIGYLAYTFRKVPKPTASWQFGVSAIIALLHDVIVLTGFYVILTRFTNSRFDSLYITAFLSVIGFSVSDTIVVFDRVREKLLSGEKFESFKDLINESIASTFTRSLLTGLSAQIVLFSIFLFGVHEVQYFALTMFVGILLGTYSSIVVASVSLVWLNKVALKKD